MKINKQFYRLNFFVKMFKFQRQTATRCFKLSTLSFPIFEFRKFWFSESFLMENAHKHTEKENPPNSENLFLFQRKINYSFPHRSDDMSI